MPQLERCPGIHFLRTSRHSQHHMGTAHYAKLLKNCWDSPIWKATVSDYTLHKINGQEVTQA